MVNWVSLLVIICAALIVLARMVGQRFDRMVWVPAGCFMMGSDPAQDPNTLDEIHKQKAVLCTNGQ